MVSLVDVAPLSDQVEIRGKMISTNGLPLSTIAKLLEGSLELRMIFAGRKVEGDIISMMATQAPLALAQCIAAGTGKEGDPDTIEVAYRGLTAGEQFDLAKSIFSMTWPRGVKSFVDEVTTLLRSVEQGRGGKAPGTNSPGQHRSSSAPAIPQERSGATRQDSLQPSES